MSMIISLILAGIVVLIDQLTKFLVYGSASKSIIGNLLWFESTLNTGVAFSMFKDNSNFFIVLSSIAVVVFIFLIVSNKVVKNKSQKICLGFMMGGTLGNLIDRIIFGGVRDFIYLKFINFAIFNIADMAVSFGAIILCVFILYYEFKIDKSSNNENINNENNGEEKLSETKILKQEENISKNIQEKSSKEENKEEI